MAQNKIKRREEKRPNWAQDKGWREGKRRQRKGIGSTGSKKKRKRKEVEEERKKTKSPPGLISPGQCSPTTRKGKIKNGRKGEARVDNEKKKEKKKRKKKQAVEAT
jgi:hypothetical protein